MPWPIVWPVVEERARARLALVVGDDAGLDGGAAGDEIFGGEGGGVAGARFEEPDKFFIEDEAVLDELRQAGVEVAGRERGEEGGVGEDEAGLGESADEVLADDVVDAGLATDGGINHAEEAGGNVDEGDTAQGSGGCEPAQVGDDAAAEADEEVAAFDALAQEPVVDGGDSREGLVLLAGGDGHALGAEASGTERVEGSGGEEGTGSGVGEQEGAAGEPDGFAKRAEVGEGAFAHDDGVARARGAHGGGNAGDPSVRGGVGLVPEAQDFVADLRGSKVVDVDRGVGAGVVGAASFQKRLETFAGVAGEEGAGLVGWLAGETFGGDGGADGEPHGEAVGKHPAACIVRGSAAAGGNDHAGGAGGASKGSTLELAKLGFTLLAEDGGNRTASPFLDEGVGIDEGPAEAVGEEASNAGLAAPGEADEEDVVRHGVQPEWARGPSVRRWCSTLARISARLSPPNFSSQASARTIATIASATTPAAGTTQTSLRS